VLAVSWITPVHAGDSPTIWRSQSITTSSISVAAGEVCQLMPCTPSPAHARSPRIDA
jgi:hypothetical protein